MSLMIRNMEMPESCGNCPFRIKANPDENICRANGELFEETLGILINFRHKDCPLVSIPAPHGRLIDADDLDKMLKFIGEAETQIYGRNSWRFVNKCRQAIEDAPTVIPAEEVYADGYDTAGNYHWIGTHTGEHVIPVDREEQT